MAGQQTKVVQPIGEQHTMVVYILQENELRYSNSSTVSIDGRARENQHRGKNQYYVSSRT